MGRRSAVKGSLLGIRAAAGSTAAADVLQVESSGETAVRTTDNKNPEGRPRHGGVVNGDRTHRKLYVPVFVVCIGNLSGPVTASSGDGFKGLSWKPDGVACVGWVRLIDALS